MQAAQIRVRQERGRIVVQATGRTEKGRTFIKGSKTLTVTSMADIRFKAEMARAVEELLGSEA